MSSIAEVQARSAIPLSELRPQLRRRVIDIAARCFVWIAFVAAVVPLVLLLYFVASKGLPYLTIPFLTHSMAFVQPGKAGGGIYAAIVGTLEQVLLATLIAVPLGLLASIYMSEYGRGKLRTA